MTDPFSDIAFNPINNNNIQHSSSNLYSQISINPHTQSYKLPKVGTQKERKIDKNQKVYAKHLIKSSNKLPIIKVQSQSKPGFKQRSNHRQKSEGDDFMTEIQKKLKLVFEGQKNNEFAQDSDSDEEFEKKVLKNKEMIKKQKLKREAVDQNVQNQVSRPFNQVAFETEKKPYESSHEKVNKSDPSKAFHIMKKSKQKIDSIYERKMKDYRDQSSGNKILMKKKQAIAKEQSQKKNESFEAPSFLGISPNKTKALRKQPILQKSTNLVAFQPNQKEDDLFQGIHNILLNPARKSQNDIISKTEKSKKEKQQLIENLKIIEQKLSLQRKQDLEMLQKINRIGRPQENANTSQLSREDHTATWRKVEISHMNVLAKKTNFDEEIERLSSYLERNEKSIQKYISNQKLISNIELIKKLTLL